ncbi:MAG: GDP-mannose 4,6-dehydratase [Candidatus Promineifilaceae bacterium]|jgi:GDP-4-dehydro-6-deoxy-D-mannose reductase
MRVFVTGATGFAGSHLVDQLLEAGDEIYALVHGQSSHQPLPDHPRLTDVPGDLLDFDSLNRAISEASPDVIYHLAGQSSPGFSWARPALTLAINAGGTANILKAAVENGRPRTVVVTSADVYSEITPEMLPLTEETEVQPNHPYGISKVAASQLVNVYWQRYGLPVVEARPFNHIGPRQTTGFVVPDFASQIAAVKLGLRDQSIMVGNLDAQRDFTDVRDVARAYTALATKGKPGHTYIICSGRPVPISYLMDTLVELAGIDVDIIDDPARIRPSDTPLVYGSHERITADTGWQPQISIEQSLEDALEDWLARTKHDSET